MKVALVQLNSSDDPESNTAIVRREIAAAAAQGVDWILTPEVTNCVSASRTRQLAVLQSETADQLLAVAVQEARRLAVNILIGSIALKLGDANGSRFSNRSFLIDRDGKIAARYDKIHMFDVEISETETYRESATYRPGTKAVLSQVDNVPVGLSICYDVRFPYLYRSLARDGAKIITVPSAFSPETGVAHWETLLRARAIETGSYILAPAQTGQHSAARGRTRSTHGHSLVVDPWGKVLLDAGTEPGVFAVDLDISLVDECRRRLPSLYHDRAFEGPR